MRDALEKLFYKYLKKEMPEDADWNTPSDEVWAKIDQALDQQDKDRKPLWWLWLAMLAFVFIFFTAGYHIYTLQKRVHKLESASAHTPMANSTEGKEEATPKEALRAEKHPMTAEEESKPQTPLTKTNTQSSALDKPRLEKTTEVKPEISASPSNETSGFGPEKEIASTASGSVQKQYENEQREISAQALPGLYLWATSLPEIVSLDLRELTIDARTLAVTVPSSEPVLPPPAEEKFFLSFYGGPSLTAAPVKGVMSTEFQSMQGSGKYMGAWHTGVDVGWKFGAHWSVASGLSYRSISVWSLAETQAAFDASTEVQDAGGYMKSLQRFSIPSSMGMLDSEIALHYPASMGIQAGDMLDASMDVTRNLQVLSIPLTLGYEHVISSKLSLDLSLEASWNKILKSVVVLDPSIHYQGESMEVASLQMHDVPVSNHWQFRGGTGFRYDLNSAYSLGFYLAYYQSIRPNFTLEKMHSRIRGFDLGAKIYYQF